MRPIINIFTENIYEKHELDEKSLIDNAVNILNYYLDTSEVYNSSCLFGQDYNTLCFDILYCGSEKTHQINKEYRNKDYAADIITFAIFADSNDEEKFIFDGEINLGEIIIALDKIEQNSIEKNVTFDYELNFLIAHGMMHLLGFDHQSETDYNFIVDAQNKALSMIKDL